MKKYLIVLAILSLTLINCEKDDICVEATTPNLIVVFKDFENQTDFKELSSLTYWINEKDSIVLNQTIDSIAFPVDLTQNNTQYIFKTSDLKDTLNLVYTRKDIFVSRSCGYKTIFEGLQNTSNSTNWIKDITINNTTIENETAAHITIFH
jgi:hypothetical protein